MRRRIPVGEKPTIVAGIPVFNEEKTIAKVAIRASRHVDRVAVIDDGSTDDTAMIAERLGLVLLRHDRNRGKGLAVRTCLRWARGVGADVLVTLDGDGQHDPDDIPRVLRPVLEGRADIVIGSRAGRPSSMSRSRRVAQRSLDRIVNVKSNGVIVDSQSGFRAYSKKAIEAVEVTEPGLGVDSEILMKASRRGLIIAEVPVAMRYDVEHGSKVSPLVHFSDVVSTVAREVFARRPLRFLGIPGIILTGYGLYGWLDILAHYNVTQEFATGHAIYYTIVLLGGIFLAMSAVILFVTQLMIQEIRRS